MLGWTVPRIEDGQTPLRDGERQILMNTGEHVSLESLAAVLAGEATAAEREHLDHCAVCRERMGRLRAFSDSLDRSWNADALRSIGVVHPSSAALERLWMGEMGDEEADAIRTHVADCGACAAHLAGLKEGFEHLMHTNPLEERVSWSQVVQRRFAAAVEVMVEAARGSFTSAGSLLTELMTPQAHTRLAPAGVVAMGGTGTDANTEDLGPWSDVVFRTDEISGSITGSTDQTTGRGVLTVVINKAPIYAGRTPLVELIRPDGQVAFSQHAVDTGDRYLATFSHLDEGRYLVAVREPND